MTRRPSKKQRANANRMDDYRDATALTPDVQQEPRVPLAGFESLYEITRSGHLFSVRAKRFIKRASVVGALTCLLTSVVHTLAAQPAPTQVTRPTCATCRITIKQTLTLGDNDGPGELDANPWLACSSQHRYAATRSPRPAEISFFDSLGHFVGVTGRRGHGPGEYERAFPIRFSGERLVVYDLENARRTVIGPNRTAIAMTPFNMRVIASLPLPNDDAVVQGVGNTKESVGFPLHIVAPDGRIRRSFGTRKSPPNGDFGFLDSRRIALGAGGVWVAPPNEYRIEQYALDGRLVRSLAVPTPWFARWEKRPQQGPPPTLIGLREDRSGLLWVLVSVPDNRYVQVAPDTPAAQQPSAAHQFDTIVEVIDPRMGTVLATQRVDTVLRDFACDDTSYSYFEDAELRAHVAVWRLVFSRN